MSTSSYFSYDAMYTTQIIVPVGGTLAVYNAPVAGQVGWQIEALMGATCEILAASIGLTNGLSYNTTQTAANLATMSGKGYLISGNTFMIPHLHFKGPVPFYLASLGATSTVCLNRLIKL